MNILKKENWWIWLMLFLFSSGGSTIILGALLDVFDKNAWYANWKNWLIAFLCLIFPAFIMAFVFLIQITCLTAAKLEVPGKEIYLSPTIWILLLILPVIGWVLFSVLYLYISIWTIVMLYRGKGEKYCDN